MKKYFKKLPFLFAIALVFIVSCSKDDGEKTPAAQTTPILKDNVKIIDATNLELDLTQTQLDAGVYQFTATGTIPTIAAGDVIVGDQGEGFLRKVTSVVVNGNTITLQTTQGSMTDVFKEGGFNFNLDMTDMQNRTSSSGFSYTIPSLPVYQQGALSIVLNSGQVDFNPNWFFDFDFDETGINSFEVSAKNATLNGDFTAQITASQSVTLLDRSSSILPNARPYKKTYTKYVPAVLLGLPVVVPIKVVMELDLVLDYSASIGAAITRQAKFTSNNTFNLGVKYANGQWNDINSFSPANNFTLLQRTGNATATINLALTPKVSFKLYGAIGPYAQVGLMEELSGAVASPSLDWDFKADVWLKSKAGVNDVSILDFNLQGYNKTWETEKLSYLTPYKIEKVSGDNQTGNFGQPLTAPIKVRVLDNLDRIQSNVPVYFTVSEGGGSVQTASILTDTNGFAETQWTLGASGLQRLNVSAKKADGTTILNAPLSFAATGTDSPCGNITDIDGNLYPSVTIGTQCWMQANLNVSKYRNGDPIPQVQDPTAWAALTTGAWCYYENNTANGTVYGKLYNWYAVNDPRGLAPVGYHVPSDGEWTTLTTFLGGQSVAGGKMKSTTLWDSPNTGATNSSGFTGLPGGWRFYFGVFLEIGGVGLWWSSTEYSTTKAWGCIVVNNDSYAGRSADGANDKKAGFSVRCLRD